MPRHNRGISLPINEDGNGNKTMFPKLGFFTVVGGVMAALSLKERWDACKGLLVFFMINKHSYDISTQIEKSQALPLAMD